jgi:hypothetical protein
LITLVGAKEANSYLYINNVKTSVPFADTAWSYPVIIPEDGKIKLYSEDVAGNPSEDVIVTVVQDFTAPTIASSTPAANAVMVSVDSVSITLAGGSASADLQASLAGAVLKNALNSVINGSWSVSGDAIVFMPSSILAEGVYTVTLYPVDTISNKGYATFNFTVDKGPPTVQSFALNPASPVKAGTATLTLTFNEAMDTAVQPIVTFGAAPYGVTGSWVDTKTWRGSYNLTAAIGDGAYIVTVKGAKDKAGNVMADQNGGNFILDTTPLAGAVNLNAKPLAGGSIQFTWQAGVGEVSAGYYLYRRVSGTTNSFTKEGGLIPYPLKDYIAADEIKYDYVVTAADLAGNESGYSNIVGITADKTPPYIVPDGNGNRVRYSVISGKTYNNVYGFGTYNVEFVQPGANLIGLSHRSSHGEGE